MTWNSVLVVLQAVGAFMKAITDRIAAYLVSNDAVAVLTKEFLFTVIITAIASTVVKRVVDRAERKKHDVLVKPIEQFTANALTIAHAEVREAILQIPELGKRRARARAGWLVQELSRIYTSLSSSVIGSYAFFNDNEKAALAAYLSKLVWRNVGNPPSPQNAKDWVSDLNSAFSDLKRKFTAAAPALVVWTNLELEELVGVLDVQMRPTPSEAAHPPSTTLSEFPLGSQADSSAPEANNISSIAPPLSPAEWSRSEH